MAAGISIALGIITGLYFLLFGHRWVGPKAGANARYDVFHAQYGFLFKVMGWGSFVVVVLEGVSLLFARK